MSAIPPLVLRFISSCFCVPINERFNKYLQRLFYEQGKLLGPGWYKDMTFPRMLQELLDKDT